MASPRSGVKDAADPRVHDFAASSGQESLRLNTSNPAPDGAHLQSPQFDGSSVISPSRVSIDSTLLRRRPTRSKTIRHFHSPTRKEWEEPGAEPGIDAANDSETLFSLHAHCDITVVDFSDERTECHELDNDTLDEFLQEEKEDWVACRWINVNGLSWDVIKALGTYKGLHPLATEDLMNTRGRTKVDWYSDQAYSACCSCIRCRLALTFYSLDDPF
jgi:hypothetical protein